MNDRNRTEFTKLMYLFAELSAGNNEMRIPSKIKIELYFNALGDMELNEILERGAEHFKRNKWFPAISELREDNSEQQAIEDFNTIDELMANFYDPSLGSCCLAAMEEVLKARGKEYLLPLLMKWGPEIGTKSNITATRAQFLKSYEIDRKLLAERCERRKIDYQSMKEILSKNPLIEKKLLEAKKDA